MNSKKYFKNVRKINTIKYYRRGNNVHTGQQNQLSVCRERRRDKTFNFLSGSCLLWLLAVCYWVTAYIPIKMHLNFQSFGIANPLYTGEY